MHRHGFTEECYFDYTFSPIRGDSGKVEGVFNAVLETTTRVIERERYPLENNQSGNRAVFHDTASLHPLARRAQGLAEKAE